MEDTRTTKRQASEPHAVSPPHKKRAGVFVPYLDPKVFLRPMSGPKQIYDMLKEEESTVSFKSAANGLFKIVYVNRFGSDDDAYDWPVYRAIQSVNKTNKLRNDTNFVNKFRFLASAPRRFGKDRNEPRYSKAPVMNKAGTTVKYKQKCYIVATGGLDETFSCLQHIATEDAPTRVKLSFDETDAENQSLDHYLTDETIIRLLQKTWNKPVDHRFYDSSSAKIRDAFFSRPFPVIASKILGYPEGYEPDFNIDYVELDNRESSNPTVLDT